MSLQTPALGEALLVLPETEGAALNEMSLLPDEMNKKLLHAHARVHEQANAGEEIFRAAIALQEGAAGSLLSLIEAEMMRNLQSSALTTPESGPLNSPDVDDDSAKALHAQAAALVVRGEIGNAITVLCALLDWDNARHDALLGLTICAIRLERYDTALALVLDYLKRGGRHPRAYCIAGLCYLKSGDKKQAQTNLAIAARAARSDAMYRDELRDAQRLLIMINFGC